MPSPAATSRVLGAVSPGLLSHHPCQGPQPSPTLNQGTTHLPWGAVCGRLAPPGPTGIPRRPAPGQKGSKAAQPPQHKEEKSRATGVVSTAPSGTGVLRGDLSGPGDCGPDPCSVLWPSGWQSGRWGALQSCSKPASGMIKVLIVHLPPCPDASSSKLSTRGLELRKGGPLGAAQEGRGGGWEGALLAVPTLITVEGISPC